MKTIKKIITAALCAAMLLSLGAIPAFAADPDDKVVYDGSEKAEENMVICADDIEKGAFSGNKTIVHLTFKPAPNDTVIGIGGSAFSNMPNLETVTFEAPAVLTGTGCFSNCPNLTTITFSENCKDASMIARNTCQNSPNVKIYGPGGGNLERSMTNGLLPRFYSTNGIRQYEDTKFAETGTTTKPEQPPVTTPETPAVTGCSDWAKEIIVSAIQKNIVPSGLQSKYTSNITRQDMCRLIMQLLRQTAVTIPAGSNPFTDVNDADVTAAAALGIVNGVSATKFDPSGSITREQAATMLARFVKRAGGTSANGGTGFKDASSFSSWAVEGIASVSSLVDPVTGSAVMGGVSADRFDPKGTFTREQAITTTLRLANILGVE